MKIQHLNGIGQPPAWVREIWDVDDLHQQPNGIYASSGLRGLLGLGTLANIKIGNKIYSQAQLQDATLFASPATQTYRYQNNKLVPYKLIPNGQPIGVVFTYLPPSQNNEGRGLVMFQNTPTVEAQTGVRNYYVWDENTSPLGLDEQGVKTVEQEVKEAEEEKLKEDSPIEYYIKKYGGKALLIVGGIVIVGGIARELIRAAATRTKSAPVDDKPADDPKPLEGITKSTIKTIKV